MQKNLFVGFLTVLLLASCGTKHSNVSSQPAPKIINIQILPNNAMRSEQYQIHNGKFGTMSPDTMSSENYTIESR